MKVPRASFNVPRANFRVPRASLKILPANLKILTPKSQLEGSKVQVSFRGQLEYFLRVLRANLSPKIQLEGLNWLQDVVGDSHSLLISVL